MSLNGSTPERILIVDDERAIRELMRRVLETSGYVCVTAASGEEADELLASGSYHLMLADLQLPGESGLDLIGRVRDAHPDTAAIMVTGTDDPQLADTALKLGACGYVVKPFSPTVLSIHVLNALRRRKLEIEQRHEEETSHRLPIDGTGSPRSLAGSRVLAPTKALL
jgi:DNA-binding response OmpR family regulator